MSKMERTTFAILVMVLIAFGAFIGSNVITNWVVETQQLVSDLKRNLIEDHREKMREILKSTSDSILHYINSNDIDVTKNENIIEVINQHVSVLKNEEFGELLLIRISPDGKILYDSYWGTLRSVDLGKKRTLNNEIIPQTLAKEVINNNLKDSGYLDDNRITVEEMEEIRKNHPNLFKSIAEYINYQDLSNVKDLLNKIKSGNSTNSENKYNWELDSGEVQLLEWITIPPGSLGFNDVPDSMWGIENKNHRWVLILRSNKDNILRSYKGTFRQIKEKIAITKILYMFLIFILISSIIIISYYIAILEKNK